MDLGAILLIFSILILVVIFVSRPLLLSQPDQAGTSQADAQDHKRSELLAEYERAIGALQELDFDNALGKIPAEEYPAQRAELLASGAETLKKIDALQAEIPAGNVEERLEAAIAARRADQVAVGGTSSGNFAVTAAAVGEDPLEAMISARRQNRQEKSGGFCPRCGRPVLNSDRFCPHCGMTLGN